MPYDELLTTHSHAALVAMKIGDKVTLPTEAVVIKRFPELQKSKNLKVKKRPLGSFFIITSHHHRGNHHAHRNR